MAFKANIILKRKGIKEPIDTFSKIFESDDEKKVYLNNLVKNLTHTTGVTHTYLVRSVTQMPENERSSSDVETKKSSTNSNRKKVSSKSTSTTRKKSTSSVDIDTDNSNNKNQ